MACSRNLPPVQKRVVTTSITETFIPFTEWGAAIGVDTAMAVIKRRAVQTAGTAPTLNFKFAIQVAQNRTDEPSDPVAVAGAATLTGAGETNTTALSVASYTAGKAYVRFGILVYLGGTTPKDGQADVEMTVSALSCGSMVANNTQEIVAFNTTSEAVVAVSPWMRSLDVVKVVGFFALTNVVGDFRCRLMFRTASTNIQSTSAWQALEITYRSTNGESATTELSPTLTGEMFVQLGVAYSQSAAGSAPGQATVSVQIGVRR